MADEKRVAVIGYGLGGSVFHAPLIAATPGLRLTTVVTGNEARAEQARRDHPGVEVVGSADDLWERADELDLVAISSPNRTHAPLAHAALEAGVGAVVDKPFAATSAEGRAVAELAKERGLVLSVYQNRRWDGDFLTLRKLLAEGEIGEVYRFESRFARWRPVPKGGWREQGDPAEAGGLLFDLGSHLIDQALVLFGPVASVYAELDVRRAGVAVEDDAYLSLTHVSGTRSQLWMSAVAADPVMRMRVQGSRGAYVKDGLDVQEEELRAGGRPGTPGWGHEPRERWGRVGVGDDWRVVETEPGAYERFYAGVAAALRGEAPVPVDPMDSVAGLEVIEAAKRSSAERSVVHLT